MSHRKNKIGFDAYPALQHLTILESRLVWSLIAPILVFALAAPSLRADDLSNSSDSKKTSASSSDDVDELITNNRMRAQTGSKSKYSIASTFSYLGGSINKPLEEARPDISGNNQNTVAAQLIGEVSGKYALDSRHAFLLGVGLRWITPLYGTSVPGLPITYTGQKYDVEDPSLSYMYIYKWAGIQSVLSVSTTLISDTDMRALGYLAGFGVYQNNIYEIGRSGISVGLSVGVGFNTFDKSGGFDSRGGYIPSEQTAYDLNANPFIEYQINRRVNLRTVIITTLEHIQSFQNPATFRSDRVAESFGVGILVTRDIFFYPNVQFIPDSLRPSDTNVGMSAFINVF